MNPEPKNIIFDTSVLISAALFPQSQAAKALVAAFLSGRVFRSEETLNELTTVLYRQKFDRYFSERSDDRTRFLRLYEANTVHAIPSVISNDCADPKDNMFLSLALSVNADVIVSGDKAHLLSMHPYKGVALLSVQAFLQWVLMKH